MINIITSFYIPKIYDLESNNIRLKEKVDLWVDKKCFITLDEWRQSQLNKLEI